MKEAQTNIFIVDSNKTLSQRLSDYLYLKFGSRVNINSFDTEAGCLAKINNGIQLVILSNNVKDANGGSLVKSIKESNSETDVIIYTTNENVYATIEAFRNGASDYIIKSNKSLRSISQYISKKLIYPIEFIVSEFGINKYLAMFLVSFLTLIISAIVTMQIMK
nr:response regulator [Bacteroidota bacterium]